VAVGSPEAQNARGELLDMEAELGRILDAIERARNQADVRILEQASVENIREALDQSRYHVLYLSCHARPGELILEDQDGKEDAVGAKKLWEEALPGGRGVPLIVLAGCATGLHGPAAQASEALPSVARELVIRGVPAVVAMQGPVGDRYATQLGGALLEALATWETPSPLAALAEARRRLESERIADTSPQRPSPEWATPTLYTARAVLPLYDPKAPFECLSLVPEPRLDAGVVVRRVGDFVGRRREQRIALKTLRDAQGAGVLVHGMGGVGKSTFTAQVMHRLAKDDWLLASVAGAVDVDQALSNLGLTLLKHCIATKRPEDSPLRQVASLLCEPKVPWSDRLELLHAELPRALRLALLLDNFEDNLDKTHAPPDALGEFLARWLAQPGTTRLLITSRYPFRLPQNLETRLKPLHLGPLSPAEARKLILRLKALNALAPDARQRAYEQVGGHPRALEYLDALLHGGKAHFDHVTRRLNAALAARGIADPSQWCADAGGDLHRALAETVTLAADDVLLDGLLAQLEDRPLARHLLFGTAVYRVPVDEAGLLYQVGEAVQPPAEAPQAQADAEALLKAATEAQSSGRQFDVNSLALSPARLQTALQTLQARSRPPLEPPKGLAAAVESLQHLSLLAPFQPAEEDAPRYTVHRWTAAALAPPHPTRRPHRGPPPRGALLALASRYPAAIARGRSAGLPGGPLSPPRRRRPARGRAGHRVGRRAAPHLGGLGLGGAPLPRGAGMAAGSLGDGGSVPPPARQRRLSARRLRRRPGLVSQVPRHQGGARRPRRHGQLLEPDGRAAHRDRQAHRGGFLQRPESGAAPEAAGA
jgi:hypothetical protein